MERRTYKSITLYYPGRNEEYYVGQSLPKLVEHEVEWEVTAIYRETSSMCVQIEMRSKMPNGEVFEQHIDIVGVPYKYITKIFEGGDAT